VAGDALLATVRDGAAAAVAAFAFAAAAAVLIGDLVALFLSGVVVSVAGAVLAAVWWCYRRRSHALPWA